MRSRLIITILSLILLVFVTSCSNTLRGMGLSEVELKEIYPCLNTLCGQNEVCANGECICAEGFKQCDGKACISKDRCCSDNECGFGEDCINNNCVFSCRNVQAVANKVCDPVEKALVCMPKYKWCEEQFRCIPEDNCCSKFDCARNERCVPSSWSAEICLEDTAKNCRFINEGEEKVLKTKNSEAAVKVSDIFYDKKAKVVVDGIEIELTKGSRYSVGTDERILLVGIKEYGGFCKKVS